MFAYKKSCSFASGSASESTIVLHIVGWMRCEAQIYFSASEYRRIYTIPHVLLATNVIRCRSQGEFGPIKTVHYVATPALGHNVRKDSLELHRSSILLQT